MEEIWKDIEGCAGYKVSNTGRVIGIRGWILKQTIDRDGYCKVELYRYGQKSSIVSVHRIVLSAFVPNIENKPTVNHKDGNKQNNCVENLEWNTVSENISHAYKTKLRLPICVKGNLNRTKYTREQILTVKNMLSAGVSQIDISRKISVSKSAVHRIKAGVTWANVI